MLIVSKAVADFADPSFGLYIEGSDFNDTLYGTAYADEIHARSGSDVVYAGGGDDFVFGEAGNDSLFGGLGNDMLDGGIGNDLLVGGAGADALIGGTGFDTASYASASTAVYVNLATNTGVYGDAQGDTFSGIEKVVGSSYSDWLAANDNGNLLDGGAGHDYLVGGTGLDVLIGGAGSDTLEGGRGLDVLTGGGGADYFMFNRDDGPDVIMDFEQGVDKIILGDGFSTSMGFFGLDGELETGTEVPTIGSRHNRDVVFYDTDDHQLYQLSYGWGHAGVIEATLLASFATNVQLQTSDFLY